MGLGGVSQGLLRVCRGCQFPPGGTDAARRAAPALHARQGAVRVELRVEQPSGLGANPPVGHLRAAVSHRPEPRFVPLSTYRLQVHGGFPLAAARDVVPYLACLGVSACYTSPYFAAGPGSTHGYDVADHNEVSAEAGGLPALQEL